jgi:WD40 repeat protein
MSSESVQENDSNSNPSIRSEINLRVQLRRYWPVTSIAFNHDSTMLASANLAQNAIDLWDVASGYQLRTLIGHSSGVESVVFSPRINMLASGGWDNVVVLWNVSTGEKLFELRGHSRGIESLAFSPDGRLLASGSQDHTIRVWDIESRQTVRILKGHSGSVDSLAFHPKENILASAGDDKTINLWDLNTGHVRRTIRAHTKYARHVAFSPDGRLLASGSLDRTIKIWETATGRLARIVSAAASLNGALAFSPDSTMLAAINADKIELWNVVSGTINRTLQPELLSINPYELTTIHSIEFSPDGKHLALGFSNITIWDIQSNNQARKLQGYSDLVISNAISPDGHVLASAGGSIKLWDLSDGHILRTLVGHAGLVTALAFSPDGATLASGGSDKTIKLWNIKTGALNQVLGGFPSTVDSVAFSPDGQAVAGGCEYEKAIKVWKVGTLAPFLALPMQGRSIAFTKSGQVLVSRSWDDKIVFVDLVSGRKLPPLKTRTNSFDSSVFSSDGQMLASANSRHVISLWNLSGIEGRQLSGHSQHVNSISFSSDRQLLASGSDDRTIRLWDVTSGEQQFTSDPQPGAVKYVAFTPNQQYLISVDSESVTKVWRVVPPNDDSGGQIPDILPRRRLVEICSLASFAGSDWLVADVVGHFDTNNLDNTRKLHWILTTDPLRPLPLEIFMRDFYEPDLMRRLLNEDHFRPVRALASLNYAQPIVEIIKVQQHEDKPELLSVTVRALESTYQPQQGDARSSGVYDLRLFRDGQLVARDPSDQMKLGLYSRPLNYSSFDEELMAWRHTANLNPDRTTGVVQTFVVKLPQNKNITEVELSAYAFNSDRVKGETDRRTYKLPRPLRTSTKGKAYIISVGVGANEDHRWNLLYPVNDARKMQDDLSKRLFKQYDQVIQIPLVSGYGGIVKQIGGCLETKPTAEAIYTVLALLAGKDTDAGRSQVVNCANDIRRAEPEDLVIFTYSGHGYNDNQGNYYIFPYDTGSATNDQANSKLSDNLVGRLISSDKLSAWMQDIDAGEIIVILDACQSGALVGREFKPGPMGSRGLGQLAYDKQMSMIVATQADNQAVALGLLSHGLLTYALTVEGLEAIGTQKLRVREWFEKASERVPKLYEEKVPGNIKQKNQIQKPGVFDFSRKLFEL